METKKIIYPTERGERCVPFQGELTPHRAHMIEQFALGDGCTDINTVRRQLAEFQ